MDNINKYQPTEAELEILQILWQKQPASVKVIHEILSQKKAVSYTTVLTQVQRLYDKKEILSRTKEGKTYLYRVLVDENQVQNNLLNRLVKGAFRGSSMDMVLHALGREKASLEDIEALEAWLQAQKK